MPCGLGANARWKKPKPYMPTSTLALTCVALRTSTLRLRLMASDTVVVSADRRLLISPAASTTQEEKRCALRQCAPQRPSAGTQGRHPCSHCQGQPHMQALLCARPRRSRCFWCVCHNRLLMLQCCLQSYGCSTPLPIRTGEPHATITPQTPNPTPQNPTRTCLRGVVKPNLLSQQRLEQLLPDSHIQAPHRKAEQAATQSREGAT